MGEGRASSRWAASCVLALLLPLAAVTVDAVPAQANQPARTEAHVPSTAPDASLVSESYVSLYSPLPAADGPRPVACDRIGYLRFRSTQGSADPAQADTIFVAQPGIFGGAAEFDEAARNVVRTAAAGGRHVEFWALDRRSQCLQDRHGIQAAAAAGNPELALDYYYRGATVAGQRFAGFVSEQNAEFLSDVGVAQTVRDEDTVISQLPSSVRRSRVLCGGHSLGGLLTADFADWDFDGNPADAGYNQCAGYFALDTRLDPGLAALLGGLGITASMGPGTGLDSLFAIASRGLPYLNSPPFTPETTAAVPISGLAAYLQPDALSTVPRELPTDFNFNVTNRFFFSNDWGSFLTGVPDARQFNTTNAAILGLLFGDVSQPIGILRSSVGVPAGGQVVRKSFPVPYGSASIGGLLGGNRLIAPSQPNGPLYTWLDYRHVPSPPPAPADDPGNPYTSAASQVSDLHQLARALFEAPAAFTEDYFPSRLVLDLVAVSAGDRSGDLAGLRYDGIAKHPAAYVDTTQGLTPTLPPPALGPPPSTRVVASGYNHLDVVTAAFQQTSGQPEISSSTLAAFAETIGS